MNNATLIHIAETDSTNNYLTSLCDKENIKEFTCVYADFQTSGRGQRGNCWESETRKNLLFSFVVFPHFLNIRHQFLLSEITALALYDTLSAYTPDISIKWPNDIYWKDCKLCGTLIENDLTGEHINRSISGTGINLNQTVFTSDAPNPVSLQQITGSTYDRKIILRQFMKHLISYYELLRKGKNEDISAKYKTRLYRRNGFFPYKDAQGSFYAQIDDVESTGKLILTDDHLHRREYLFKEVKFVIDKHLL